jgi:hypothetical protein
MSLKSLAICERKQVGVTPRDGLIGAAVMLDASLLSRRWRWPPSEAPVPSELLTGDLVLARQVTGQHSSEVKSIDVVLGEQQRPSENDDGRRLRGRGVPVPGRERLSVRPGTA